MKKIVVLPGGFHPFHAGHLALYKQALAKFKDADVYMAASDDQKNRPFPFKLKQLLATEVAGIPKNRFVQVKSPFIPKEITSMDKYDSEKDALIVVRSKKDQNKSPLPDQIRKSDGKMGYYISYPLGENPALEPFADHAYIDYLAVVPFAGGMTSATEIRNAWPKLDELGKIELIKGMYPEEEMTVPKVKKISQILDSVLVRKLTEDVDPAIYTRADGSIDYTLYSMAHEEETRDKERKERRKAEKEKEKEAKKNTEFDPDAPLNTRQSASVIKRYCAERGISLDKILTQGSRNQNNLRRLVVMAQTHTKFTQEDADNIKKITKAPKVTITSGGSYLNVHGLVKGSLKETFVDPDQSKQYWNHDAQRDVIGTEIEMPLRDNDRRGRRQGFNEGEERSIISDAAINALVNAFEGHEDEFESREAIETNIYNVLSDLNVEDIVDPEMDHHGQRMGNFASGRVIDVVDSSSVIDEVMQQINYFDPADDRNYVSESLNKIRGMIKETTDEQKSKSVDLHHKLFELMEEERDNISDLSHYRKQRQMQSNYLTTIENLLMGLHEEFAEMEQLKLMPIHLSDTFENIKDLIKYIQNYDPVKDNFPFPKDLLEKLQLKTVQLKEYFGGMRDRSAPRVLRKQEPKSTPKDFWNKIDLSETSDYIEEK